MRPSLSTAQNCKPLARVQGLTIEVEGQPLPAVHELDLELMPGRLVGLVGESGSGKSLTGLGIMRLLPSHAKQVGGEIWLGDTNLCTLSEDELCALRGSQVALVFQDASEALSPLHTVAWHLYTTLRAGKLLSPSLRRENARAARPLLLEALERVEVEDPESILLAYPGQLPIGTQQRVLLAIALARRPKLLVLDDPGKDLDASARSQLLEVVLRRLEADQLSGLLITHDLPLAIETTAELLVMRCGEVVERGPSRELLQHAQHPYTVRLLNAVQQPLVSPEILDESSAPNPGACRYFELCARRAAHAASTPRCNEAPPLGPASARHRARCHYPHLEARAQSTEPWDEELSAPTDNAASPPLLEAVELSKFFPMRTSVWGERAPARALHRVSLRVCVNERVGVIGESGSGKTTLGKLLLRLLAPSLGRVLLSGEDITHLNERDLRPWRKRMQPLFQEPRSALSPFMTVADAIAEPLQIHERFSKSTLRERCAELLERVGLSPSVAALPCARLSTGQSQLVCVARAIALEPQLLICDEPLASLDAYGRGLVAQCLVRLGEEAQQSQLIISHDVVRVLAICSRALVLHAGFLVEAGPSRALRTSARHPYTRALVAAAAPPRAQGPRLRVLLEGNAPSPLAPVQGCSFFERCSRAQVGICDRHTPPWVDAQGSSGDPRGGVACWNPHD